jgi:predicted XRE-type DNA-binding protein
MSSIKFSNAFDAVTGDKKIANELQIRADLMIALRDILEEKGWKQADTAEALKLTQPRISDLLQGKIDKFSIGLLMTCYASKDMLGNHESKKSHRRIAEAQS